MQSEYEERRKKVHDQITESDDLTIRELASRTDRSYNHVINVLSGVPGAVSEPVLDDAEAMLDESDF